MSAFIGITFGNTSSSIAVASLDGKVDVIANPDGDRAIPSALSYVGDDEYHGTQAQNQLIRNASNTVINFRDFVGKSFDEADTDAACQVGARPVKASDGSVGYEITESGSASIISIAEITKRHFAQLKLAAQDYTGKSIQGAVLTVPTDFTPHQRQVLAQISAEAGLPVLQTINEPSAALLAHLAEQDKLLQDKIYVVADFGGIRSDAAVISVRGGVMTILATAHLHGLGGQQLDAALAEHFAKEFEKKCKVSPRENPRSVAKLTAESIVVKKTLSNVQTSTCSIESLADGLDFHTSINRLRYELAAKKPLSDMTAFVESAVTKAGLETLDIDEVLLVGGSSNTPKLAANIAFIFPETTTIVAPSVDAKATDPSELVVRGAALQAALVQVYDLSEIAESLQPVVVNVQHLARSIGIKDASGAFHPILVAETAYPIKKLVLVSNGESCAVKVALHEGVRTIKETAVPVENDSDDSDSDEEPEIRREAVYEAGELIAELTLKELKPNAQVEVSINITQDGVMHISGRELKQGAEVVKCEVTCA